MSMQQILATVRSFDELLELAHLDQRRRLGGALDSGSAVREDRAP